MEQMNMQGLEVVPVDYESTDLPATAQLFKPVVYKDGSDFCCLIGPDPQAGVFGCGDTPEKAVKDWAARLDARLARQNPDDGVANYIRKKMNEKP